MNNNNDGYDMDAAAASARALARNNPGLYKFKLLAYALLGYAVIFAVLLLLAGLVGGLVAAAFFGTALLLLLIKKKVIFLILPAIWVLLKALWVRFDAPSGYPLTRERCPVLFDEIDGLRRRLKAPAIHQVILTSEFNAGVNQTPRLGVFGWQRNTLILGLELLLVLSPEQARTVLAHEFGHLSGNHSRFNGWIYRIRFTWYRVMEAFHHADNVGARLMKRFFDWYAPRFAAYSFVLAQTNEYEADAVAAALTSTETAGQALIHTRVTGPYIDEYYWQSFFKKADGLPAPDHAPWTGLSTFLKTHRAPARQLEERMARALEVETSADDTHPALKDRLAALPVAAMLPAPSSQTAAEVWLGASLDGIIADFDREWLAAHGPRWRQRYDYVRESRERLQALEQRDEAELSDEELWTKARLSEEFISDEAAFPLYESYQQRHPEDPDVAFVLGRHLFNRRDEALLAQMRLALSRPGLAIDACEYAYHYLMAAERSDEAEWWRRRASQQALLNEASDRERAQLNPGDRIIPIELSEKLRRRIVDALQAHGKVKAAWVAQKAVQHYPEFPALAIAVEFKGFNWSYDRAVAQVTAALDLDGSYFLVPKGGDYKALAKQVIKEGVRVL